MEKNEKSAILVKRALDGDSSAFEELYQTTYKSVFYHAQQILKNEEDVEDAVSETYLQAYQNLSKLQDPALFPAWINHIATNLSLKMVRDDRFRDAASFDDESFYYEPVAADADTPNMVLDRKGTEEIVGGMIEALPDVQRATVIMYYYDEMSVPAIAKAMDCSEGTVKSRLNYARKNLERAVLAEEKRGVKLYTVSPTLVFGAISLLIKSANIPLSSFMHISRILAGLTGAGIAAQASGAGAATAGSSAAASGTTVATAGGSTATAVETGASASIKAGAAAKAAAAAGGTAKTALAAKVAAGVLATAVAVGGVVAATSSQDPNEEALKTYQAFVQSHESGFKFDSRSLLIQENEESQEVYSSVDPQTCRYALYDIDGDGIVEFYYVFDYEHNKFLVDEEEKDPLNLPLFGDIIGLEYQPDASDDYVMIYGICTAYHDTSHGKCQVVKNGKYYIGEYVNHNHNSGDSIQWKFSDGINDPSKSGDRYHFIYANHEWTRGRYEKNVACEPVDGTTLYRSIPGYPKYTEPEFALTDEEFYTLIDNCVKVIGIGPEFEGQDLSMSYDEFMALQSIDDAPKPGKPYESHISDSSSTLSQNSNVQNTQAKVGTSDNRNDAYRTQPLSSTGERAGFYVDTSFDDIWENAVFIDDNGNGWIILGNCRGDLKMDFSTMTAAVTWTYIYSDEEDYSEEPSAEIGQVVNYTFQQTDDSLVLLELTDDDQADSIVLFKDNLYYSYSEITKANPDLQFSDIYYRAGEEFHGEFSLTVQNTGTQSIELGDMWVVVQDRNGHSLNLRNGGICTPSPKCLQPGETALYVPSNTYLLLDEEYDPDGGIFFIPFWEAMKPAESTVFCRVSDYTAIDSPDHKLFALISGNVENPTAKEQYIVLYVNFYNEDNIPYGRIKVNLPREKNTTVPPNSTYQFSFEYEPPFYYSLDGKRVEMFAIAKDY